MSNDKKNKDIDMKWLIGELLNQYATLRYTKEAVAYWRDSYEECEKKAYQSLYSKMVTIEKAVEILSKEKK